MRTAMALITLVIFALTGCATTGDPVKDFEPGQGTTISPDEAVIFGKVVRALDGELQGGNFIKLIPFEEINLWYIEKSFDIDVGKELYFYSVIERDSYVFATVDFGEPPRFWSFDVGVTVYSCWHYGFHMPGKADAYYIGTLFFDPKRESFEISIYGVKTGSVYVRDEFDEALEAFKRRHPNFAGQIVKSIIVADKSVPSVRKVLPRKRPYCSTS